MTIDQGTMDCSIEVEGLMKWFGRTLAVNDVSMFTDRGVIGLLGPNGAGKTTLLRMVATVLAPTNGSLRLLGHDPAVPRERVEIRRRLGYLPQTPTLYGGFTAYELLDYVAVLKEHTDRSWRRTEVQRVLESVGMENVAHQKDPAALRRHAAAGRARRRDAWQPRPAGA